MIHPVYASTLTPGHVFPRLSERYAVTRSLFIRLLESPSRNCYLPYAPYDEDPAFSARAAFACARFLTSPCLPFCRPTSISPRLLQMLDRSRSCRYHSPPTWRIAGPCLHAARRRDACRPSGFGARRGRRRRGSGCSCTVGRNAPSVSGAGAGNRRVQVCQACQSVLT